MKWLNNILLCVLHLIEIFQMIDLNGDNLFFRYYRPLEKDVALYLKKHESLSRKNVVETGPVNLEMI